MIRKYTRPRSACAYWSPRFGWPAVALLAAAVGLHHFGLIRTVALPYFAAVAGLCAVAALVCAAIGLAALWRDAAKGGMAALRGIFLAGLALAPLLIAGAAWFIVPPLYDIATDYSRPPQFLPGARPENALPAVAAFSPAAAAEARSAWPGLSGRRYDGSPDTVLPAVCAALKAEGWEALGQKGIPGESRTVLIGALAKSRIMGFSSDIVIRLTDEGDTSFVDMRAAARHLPRDYGMDAGFIDDFMQKLDAQMLRLPSDDNAD